MSAMPARLREKSHHVLTFLTGLSHPHVREVLGRHGLSDADVEAGWTLLRRVGELRYAHERIERPKANESDLLDDWAGKWWTLAGVALSKRFPAVRDRLFDGVKREPRKKVPASVMKFVTRLNDFEASSDPVMHEAMSLLERRGLTPAVRKEAADVLGMNIVVADTSALPPPRTDAALRRAEQELSDWYREWSAIARTFIRQRRLLRALGYGAPGRPKKSEAAQPARPEVAQPPKRDA
jgi:hypothetical protein